MPFNPSVYSNQRPILTPKDLGNHPRAQEYIDYLKNVKYPIDFKTWLRREEIKERDLALGDKQYVAACAADPYCRLPSKIRRHAPPSRGSNLWRRDR